ncbi:HEPN domain-containing protein [Clostridium sp. FP1]|uniref:HEPN domain-containing protein n=1 Tax=Clostridium sp. FP1 TaxID=2724076 RepID=UPI0013E98123|nr:HEPN domain-containing protein [Clostridium sp. FP1]MBZ9634613.1 hypothetical protein [Clostridium sp. FP1]
MKIYIDGVSVELRNKIPVEWRHKDNATVFIYAYKVFGIKKKDLNNLIKELLLGDTVVLLFHGTFIYSNPNKIYKIENSDFKFENPEDINAKEDTYLFLITPNEDTSLVYSKLGLLNAILGKNITCEYIFDNCMFIGEDSQGGVVTTYSFFNNNSLPVPDISDSKFNSIARAFSNISSKSGKQERKIIFSLSWFFEAINSEEDNKNIFIKNWIAIETLTMDNTRREPIGKLLGDIYSMNSSDALSYFNIQKVYKIRCKIVHEGKLINLDSAILLYLQDLYVDLLFHIIGIQSEFKAKKHIVNGLDVLLYLK